MIPRRTFARSLTGSLAALVAATAAAAVAAPAARPVAAAKPSALAPKVDSASLEFFERKVRPVLVQSCYQCHSATSEKLKGGLYVDSRAGLLKGGESGPAVFPGDPAKSLLIKAIRSADADVQMPPKQKLTDQQVADLTRWVQMGAPWPAEKKPAGAVAGQPTLTQDQKYAQLKKDHWAWQPVKQATPPTVADAAWPASDIDKFVLAKLEKAELKPVADADRVSLIRRVTFDLTGLPPTPEEIVAFVGDKSSDAYAKLVDRLLASPQFGETWGRHWLDVARYAESTGSTRNYPYHNAWRYRDYVIDSFNADKPYNTFVMEQVAGDLMPTRDPAQKNERLVATGLLAMGVKDLNERDRDKYTMDNVDEQIDVVSRSVLATTIACARCHDHKFDPIPTEEYYKVAGIFKSTEILSGVKPRRGGMSRDYNDPDALIKLAAVPVKATATSGKPAPAVAAVSKAEQVKQLQAEFQETQGELRKMAFVLGIRQGDREATKKVLQQNPAKAREFLELREEVQALRVKLDELENDKPATAAKPAAPVAALAMGARDADRPGDCRVNLHGDHDNLGAAVPRGPISLIKVPGVPTIKPDESGRLQFATWLASPENPLTARVMVNRVWHHLFGQGLVRTVDNFGSTGEAPSHPELLDYLAKQFVKDGWSVKKTIRQVVLSRTYRLSAAYAEANYNADPDNVMLWRHEQRRLTAEQIRDALLAVGGTLDAARPAGSPVAKMPDAEIREGRRGRMFDRDGGLYRSVYLPVARSLVTPMMDTFDFAEPTMVIGDRDVTTVATQALFLMNNEFAAGQSRRLAEKLLADTSIGSDADRVDHAYGRTVGRSATEAERARALAYLAAFAADAAADSAPGGKGGTGPAKARVDAWASFVQALVASAEFRYLN
jgi:hypothetical protein